MEEDSEATDEIEGIPVSDLEGRVLHDTEANELLRVVETASTEVTVRPVTDEQPEESTLPVYGGRGLRSGRYIVKESDFEVE